MHRSLNAGHRENYTQSVIDRTRKPDVLAKRMDVSRRFSHRLPSKSNLKKANTVKLTKKSAYDKIKRKWTKTGLPFYWRWLRSRSDLR